MKRQKKSPTDRVGFNHGKHTNMVWKYVHSFHSTTGIDREELFGEATVAYYEALLTYDFTKGSVITWVYRHIHNHLVNFCKKQHRHSLHHIPMTDDDVYSGNTEQCHGENILNRFSGQCLELICILYCEDIDVNKPPKLVRGALVRKLKEKGWKHIDIWNTMSEVKAIVKAY